MTRIRNGTQIRNASLTPTRTGQDFLWSRQVTTFHVTEQAVAFCLPDGISGNGRDREEYHQTEGRVFPGGICKKTASHRSPQNNTICDRSPQNNTICDRSPQNNTICDRSPQNNTICDRSAPVFIHKALNSLRAVIRCREKSGMSEVEIMTEVKEQGVVKVHRVTVKRDTERYPPTLCF